MIRCSTQCCLWGAGGRRLKIWTVFQATPRTLQDASHPRDPVTCVCPLPEPPFYPTCLALHLFMTSGNMEIWGLVKTLRFHLLSFSPLNTKGVFIPTLGLSAVQTLPSRKGKKQKHRRYNQQGNCQFQAHKFCLVFISCECSLVHEDSLSTLLCPCSENSVVDPGQEMCLTRIGFEAILT